MTYERAKAIDGMMVGAASSVREYAKWQPRWKIEKYHGEARPENLYAVEEFDGNLLLNEGITELLTLLIGGSATAFNNANARIGVGDSTAAAEATQTDLQGTNKTYKAMDTGYPQVSGQTVTFRAAFGADDANYDWQEFVVDNGAAAGKTLNRKVENHGTKASGDTWVIEISITIS
ncbi:MAG: hypothetical protein JRC53_04160 [Deltaproteobacteria bacterium]|nr:hypothetical protein [Deltaproteobacteria bacterium]